MSAGSVYTRFPCGIFIPPETYDGGNMGLGDDMAELFGFGKKNKQPVYMTDTDRRIAEEEARKKGKPLPGQADKDRINKIDSDVDRMQRGY